MAVVAARAADDKKATQIEVIDLTGISDVADYFVLATVASGPQMDAVTGEAEDKLRDLAHAKPLSVEGRRNDEWMLLDYGSVVVHVFRPEAREYYRLGHLWADAPRIGEGDWREKPAD